MKQPKLLHSKQRAQTERDLTCKETDSVQFVQQSKTSCVTIKHVALLVPFSYYTIIWNTVIHIILYYWIIIHGEVIIEYSEVYGKTFMGCRF